MLKHVPDTDTYLSDVANIEERSEARNDLEVMYTRVRQFNFLTQYKTLKTLIVDTERTGPSSQ